MPRRAESVIDEAHRIEAERLEEEADDERHHDQPQEDGRRRAAGEPGDEVVGHGLFLKSELTRRLHDFALRHPCFWRRRERAHDFGNGTTVGLDGAAASVSPATGLPLTVSFPCAAPILTVAPSRISPASSICASGSCTDFWMTRFSGRAPYEGS